MSVSKIKTLSQLKKISQQAKRENKKVGLITGCFDILHFGHIQLFRFAKKHVDLLIVGVENDQTIKYTKGEKRPINRLKYRLEFLKEIQLIDFLFTINENYLFQTKQAQMIHSNILKSIKPTHLITNIIADNSFQNKQIICTKLNIQLVIDKQKRYSSTTNFITNLIAKKAIS